MHAADTNNIFCGTDNINYDSSTLLCEMTTKYGKRINLQIKHRGRCWIWEEHGLETNGVIYVSKFEVDFIIDRMSINCVFISLQISLIIVAAIVGAYLYYKGVLCRREKCKSALTPVEKIKKVKINLYVETKDGGVIFRHDPVIIDNVPLVLIPAASPTRAITMDE